MINKLDPIDLCQPVLNFRNPRNRDTITANKIGLDSTL